MDVAERVGRVSGAETKKGCVSGWVMRNWSGVVGRGRKGVGSGTEAGIWVRSEDVEWVRRSDKWNRSGE